MKYQLLIGLILSFAIVALAFQSTSAQVGKVRKEMLVTTDWLSKNLRAKDVAVLHIAGSKASFEKAHIENARFVPWNELTSTRDNIPNELPTAENLAKLFSRLGIGDTSKIVIYGEMSGLMAARAFFTLDYLGHGNRVALLDGGLEKWESEKRPISSTYSAYTAMNFTPRVNVKAVTFLQSVQDISWQLTDGKKNDSLLLDARPPDEFSGAKPGDGIPRGGHIPGAVNLFWMENILSRENPVMKPSSDLKLLYEAKGVAPTKRIISYCRTGGQASHAYFTLKYLGYDVVMYDGSFIEWSNAADTPIAR